MNGSQIINGDCIQGMKDLEAGSINLIIADPPYNLNKDFGPWKETERKGEWKEWTRAWLAETRRVLSDDGMVSASKIGWGSPAPGVPKEILEKINTYEKHILLGKTIPNIKFLIGNHVFSILKVYNIQNLSLIHI